MAADLRPKVAYVLPDSLRGELGRAWGPIVQTDGLPAAVAGADVVVAVGDVVSLALKKLDIEPRVFICDFQTQRGEPDPVYEVELGSWGDFAFRVRNPAARITREAWDAIRLALAAQDGPVRIVVEGEEDLLGIPCFLECPLGAKVLYGMPGKGVVVVDVTAAFQEKVKALLARFERA
ncbi:MAG: GTP-dependent dephospho-CoA kinase family protein [bacterium]